MDFGQHSNLAKTSKNRLKTVPFGSCDISSQILPTPPHFVKSPHMSPGNAESCGPGDCRGVLHDSWTDATLPPGRHTLIELIAKRLLAKKLSEAPGRDQLEEYAGRWE